MNYIQQITPNCNFTLKVKAFKRGFLWFSGLKENSKFLKSNPSKLVWESVWVLAGFFHNICWSLPNVEQDGTKTSKTCAIGQTYYGLTLNRVGNRKLIEHHQKKQLPICWNHDSEVVSYLGVQVQWQIQNVLKMNPTLILEILLRIHRRSTIAYKCILFDAIMCPF